MNEGRITDPAKRKEVLTNFFASRRNHEPFPLVEEYKKKLARKRKPSDSGASTPPTKKTGAKTTDSGNLEKVDPKDPYNLGLDPIPDCKVYIPTPPNSGGEGDE